jgi:DNA-binding transcriptional MerR regulator
MQKLYYSISEICSLIGEEAHVLRYWEKEFGRLKPKKNRAGNRVYSAKDLEMLKKIRQYLREDKLSLKGAREKLDNFVDGESAPTVVKEVRTDAQRKPVEKEKAVIMPTEQLVSNNEIKNLLNDILQFLKQ